MWTSILKQMYNRKRSNAWIAIELLLVFCLTWYIIDYLFVLAYNQQLPNYRHIENTLQINLSEYDENLPQYNAEADTPEALEANYARILQTIQNYQGIEAIGISFDSSTPGGGGYSGRSFRNAKDTTRTVNGQIITIDPAYDYLKVFKFSTDNGKKMISANDFEWLPNGVILSRSASQTLFSANDATGQEMSNYDNDDQLFIVTGVIDDTKRFDYLRPQNNFYTSRKLNAENLYYAEISVRYHSSLSEKVFCEQFKSDMENALQIGNFYLLSIIPYTQIGEETATIFGVNKEVKQRIYLMIFFLLCIFLCVMGTFWYRISLRTNEIGLRKAIGATRTSIRYSLIIEGVWLLLIIILPAMLIEFQFVHAGLIDTVGQQGDPNPKYLPDRTFTRFLITNAITFVFLLAVIISAIWLPAQKGASLAPAEALHYE